MKCPYAVHRKRVTQCKLEYNDEGNQEKITEVEKNEAIFAECLQHECGAYHNGSCHYNNN